MADAEALYEERRSEDIEVLNEIGASWIHLGLTDALFRRVREAATGTNGTGRAAYPTFRFDAARGGSHPAMLAWPPRWVSWSRKRPPRMRLQLSSALSA